MAHERDKTDEEPDIKVEDRRRFNADGSVREDTAEASEPEPADTAGAPEKATEPGFHHRSKHEPATIDFSGFVLSLAQAALVDLGVAPHPEADEVRQNLPQARNTIDILGILREKTAGNLSDGETQLLDGLLYQLRMVFLEIK